MSEQIALSTIHWFVAQVDPKNAGYRVRTLPLVNELRAQGEVVEVHALADMPQVVRRVEGKARAVLVSKPADSLTALCMARFASFGVPVVIDLFDNYFSWSPAIVQRQVQWQWLRALNEASLVMCSTPFLGQVVQSLTKTPVLQVGDQVPVIAADRFSAARLATKWAEPKTIELLWFGIAGNPYYQAGLDDLVRWASVLRRLTLALQDHAPVRLTLCTNRVPAVDLALLTLRAQQIDVRYEEWTEDGCDLLLDASHVVLLPTNLTGFSLSKTHNRCSDALARSCLVLASTQGPYQGIGGAVFEEPEVLAQCLRQTGIQDLQTRLTSSYRHLQDSVDTTADVSRLRTALAALSLARKRKPDPSAPQRVLVMGRVKADVPKAARSLGCLIAGYADFGPQLEYDFRLENVDAEGGLVVLRLSPAALALTESTLARNVEVDVDDHGDHADYSVGDWRFRLERVSRRLLVLKGPEAAELRSLAAVQRMASAADSEQLAQTVEGLVDGFARVLWQLGFRDMELAAESEGGWQAFAKRADPKLAALEARLRAHWLRYAGREFAWGRPALDAA